nr:MAG TPA: hypothetical protein [Caudoviricetes sp.]
MYPTEKIVATLSPSGDTGYIRIDGAADPTQVFDMIRDQKSVKIWTVENRVDPETSPEFGPYIVSIDFLLQRWQAYRRWPEGGVVEPTYCQGTITTWGQLAGLVSMITDHMAQRRLELLHHIQEACRG